MNRLQRILQRASHDLETMGVEWCLVGGLAVSAWGEPRLTRDIDIIVAIDGDERAETIIRNLSSSGYRVEEIIEQESVGRLATVRLSLEELPNGIVIDLLFASSGIEAEATAEAVVLELFEGLVVPVARRPHLVVMKLLARDDRSRPMDADDLRSLLRDASSQDLARARELAELVIQRGYARGRPIDRLLEEAIRLG